MDETVSSWLMSTSQSLQAQGSSITRHELSALLLFVLNRSTHDKAYLFSHADQAITAAERQQLSAALNRLKTGEPLAYIVKQQGFWDMVLSVDEHVLIPRPDTETLIEAVIKQFPKDKPVEVLELGTGSAAIVLALSRYFNSANLVAVDISEKALMVAETNRQRYQKQPIQLLQSDWFSNVTGAFDIIASNPPYIAEHDPHLSSLVHEPTLALTSGVDGLSAIKLIIGHAPAFLKPNGYLFLEHGYDQKDAVQQLFQASAWQQITTDQDVAGNDRVTYAKRPLF